MKRVWILVLSILFIHPAYAKSAHLEIKIKGQPADNTYFLCVSHAGCLSIKAAKHGKIFPMGDGKINNIFALNTHTLQIYPQPLPPSCHVRVEEGQRMTVYGKLTHPTKGKTQISQLRCEIS